MARPTDKKHRTSTPEGFDVTCVVGHVSFRDQGPYTPYVAAFLLIAEHGAPGTYMFPDEVEGEVVVSVDRATIPHTEG